MKNILYTIILSFLFSSAASAEIYKWVDDEGKVHYGEKLPNNATGKAVETIKTKDSVSADSQAGFDAYNKGDYATSLKIYIAAAEQGDIMAQFTLAQIYTNPRRYKKHGVTIDYKEAAKWYRLAAEQGEDIAQFNLGRMYKKGQGVTRNLVIAHMWFNTATFNNFEVWTPSMSLVKYKNLSEEDFMKNWRKMKKKEVERLESEMTSEQIAEAKELARECIKKNYKNCVSSSLNIEKAPNKTTDKTVETIKTKDSVSADFQAIVDAYEAGDYETVYREIKLFAEQGDARAQRILGLMYKNGQGVAQDYKEAVKWYRLAAEQGFADAQYNLGVMYYEGKGVTQDFKEAVKWYRLAAEQGFADAQYNLGVMYYEGKGVTQDKREAIKWWKSAAEQGNVEAQHNLRLAAEQGLTEAQFNLGLMYKTGRGVTKDYKEAVKWYRLAAEQGDIMAQVYLGGMYKNGQGVAQDYKETVKWYRLAAEQGEDIAQFYLGTMYRDGKGVTKNLVIAHMWFNTAAFTNVKALTANNKKLSEEALMHVLEKWRKNMKGKTKRLERKMTAVEIAKAQEVARECVEKNYKDCVNSSLDIVVETIKTKDSVSADFQAGLDAYEAGDYETALKIYRAAAKQGDVEAQSNLGRMYKLGKGVTQDYKEAMKWYRLAAEQGNVGAQSNLGWMYLKGQGVTKNLVIAHMWFNTSIEAWTAYVVKNNNLSGEALMHDFEEMRRKKKIIVEIPESKMTSEQITKAQELARECIKKNYQDCG